jgi:hypothetical protein
VRGPALVRGEAHDLSVVDEQAAVDQGVPNGTDQLVEVEPRIGERRALRSTDAERDEQLQRPVERRPEPEAFGRRFCRDGFPPGPELLRHLQEERTTVPLRLHDALRALRRRVACDEESGADHQ